MDSNSEGELASQKEITPKSYLENNLLKINGFINNVETKFIIDTGSTFNFISQNHAEKVKAEISKYNGP